MQSRRNCFLSRACTLIGAFSLAILSANRAHADVMYALNVTINNGNIAGNYMGGTVAITGAALGKYTGEGFVVGPNRVPFTLASLNGGHDFLTNSGSDRITMNFSTKIYSVQFNYEIFPDGTTPNGTGLNPLTDSDWPDFTFKADGTQVFRTLAVMPPQSGYGYTGSPNNGAELAPQFIGNSGLWVFPNGVTQLEFIDWPPTIGVDGLQFSTSNSPPAVPEPPTWLVGGLLLGSLAILRVCWRRRGVNDLNAAAA